MSRIGGRGTATMAPAETVGQTGQATAPQAGSCKTKAADHADTEKVLGSVTT